MTTSARDHLVPLELGGSNDATNLWPESLPTPNPKDKVENALNAAVCDGRVKLAAARAAIAADWLTAEKKLGLNGSSGGGGGTGGAWCTASASYSATYGDYDIYVHSNQPDRTVPPRPATGPPTAGTPTPAATPTSTWTPPPGDTVKVTVGAATCSTST